MERGNPDTLPDEVLIKIFMDSDIKDIIHLCQTNKRLNEICRDQGLWLEKIKSNFPNIPQQFIDQMVGKGSTNKQIYQVLHTNFRGLRDNFEIGLMIKLLNGEDICNFIHENLPIVTTNNEYTIHGGHVILDGYSMKEDADYRFIVRENRENEFLVIRIENKGFRFAGDDYSDLINCTKLTKVLINDGSSSIYYIAEPIRALVLSIYLSQLYRNGISINFSNLIAAFRIVSPIGYAISMRFDVIDSSKPYDEHASSLDRDETIFKRLLPDMQDTYLLQMMHAVCVMERKYGLYYNGFTRNNTHFSQFVLAGDKWNGEILEEADFWAYRVGKTMLYFRPCGFIVKMNASMMSGKTNNPRIVSTDKIDLKYLGAQDSDLVRRGDAANLFFDLIKLAQPKASDRWINKLIYFVIGKNTMTDYFDLYFLLQSPTLFGEYMYPEELTPNSKVIILGEI